MTTPEPLSPVSRTALSVALVRAYESSRPDALFRDPYAMAFVRASGMPLPTSGPAGEFARRLVLHGVIRTRFYDDRLVEAADGRTGITQVVVLGAGLDTRAHRLPWQPGTRLFEVDLAPVLAFKQRVLDERGAVPRCERATVAADLVHDDWAGGLVRAGLDPERPTAWLAEGLLVYLTEQEAAHLLSAVGGLSAPGSVLLLEQGRDVTTTPREDALAAMTDLWKGGLGPGTGSWLARDGWSVRLSDLAAVSAGYGRPSGPAAGSGFLTAERIAERIAEHTG
ncbi:SAM-dependent methyltransferase [Streptomyces sp. NPDC058319]|uniref:SAM-dependent methyltransferase n=1 Tax=unclassified Streptomyces TaxID=2593676 RepID=UPI0033AD11A3